MSARRRGSVRRRRAGLRRLADERGSTMVPAAVLVFLLLSAGGLGFDLYRLLVTRQTVVGIVDSAAIAGATGVDEEHYFASQGTEVVLDPALARERAAASLAGHSSTLADAQISVAPGGEDVTVAGAIDMEFTLLRLLLPGAGSRRISAQATSTPRLAAAP